MNELVRIPLNEGELLVEVPENDPGVRRAAMTDGVFLSVAESLETALEPIRRAASTALDKFRAIGPHEVEIEFGVRLSTEAGAILVKAGGEGHLNVILRWRKT